MYNFILGRIQPLELAKPSTIDGVKVIVDALNNWFSSVVFTLNYNSKKIEDNFKPIATIQKLLVTDRVSHVSDTVEVAGKNGAVTLTSTPTISNGFPGEKFYIIGTDDTNTVKFQDESSLTGSNLQLSGGADKTLGAGDTLFLIYSATVGAWCQIGGENN